MNTQESRSTPDADPGDGAPGPATRPAGDSVADFFDRIRDLGVVRPDEGRWAAGVCAGLARRWGLDPLLVRGLFVVAGIVTGIGLGIYGLLWLFLPHPDGRIHAQQVLRGVVTAGFVGSVLFVLIDFPLSGHWSGGWGFQPLGGLAFLAAIGFGIWWLVTRGRGRSGGPGGGPGSPGGGFGTTRWAAPTYGPPDPDVPGPGTPSSYDAGYGTPGYGTPGYGTPGYGTPGYGTPGYGTPEPGRSAGGPAGSAGPYGFAGSATATSVTTVGDVAEPRRSDLHRPLHSLTLTTVGAAALAAAGVVGWDRATGRVQSTAVVATAVALGVIALGIVLAGALGRRAGGLAPLAILLAIASVSGVAWHGTTAGFDRSVTWTPVTAPASPYSIGAGRALLDLTNAALPVGASTSSPVEIPASLGVGELVIVVPAGTGTQVNATVGLGNITDDVSRTGGVDRGGASLKESLVHGGTPMIVVDAQVGLGRIRLVPQGTKVDR